MQAQEGTSREAWKEAKSIYLQITKHSPLKPWTLCVYEAVLFAQSTNHIETTTTSDRDGIGLLIKSLIIVQAAEGTS